MLSSNQKVFGLGLSKTGTSSLTEALNFLGIKTIHYPCDEATLYELQNGIYSLSIMKKWQAATDISIAPFYEKLDKEFPGSKFILTVRDKESWLRSCEQHWDLMKEWLENYPEIKRFQNFIGLVVYGSLNFDSKTFSSAYDNHVERVSSYFLNRPQDFLELNICGGEGWEKLCDFLGYDIPNQDFPKSNEWMHLVIEAKETVKTTIAGNSKTLLIDQAGFGSSFAAQIKIVPFLERDGIYWGIPDNDEVATEELLRMFGQGIEFIVIGFPCYWMLEYYPKFSATLNEFCIVEIENNSVKIFRLIA